MTTPVVSTRTIQQETDSLTETILLAAKGTLLLACAAIGVLGWANLNVPAAMAWFSHTLGHLALPVAVIRGLSPLPTLAELVGLTFPDLRRRYLLPMVAIGLLDLYATWLSLSPPFLADAVAAPAWYSQAGYYLFGLGWAALVSFGFQEMALFSARQALPIWVELFVRWRHHQTTRRPAARSDATPDDGETQLSPWRRHAISLGIALIVLSLVYRYMGGA